MPSGLHSIRASPRVSLPQQLIYRVDRLERALETDTAVTAGEPLGHLGPASATNTVQAAVLCALDGTVTEITAPGEGFQIRINVAAQQTSPATTLVPHTPSDVKEHSNPRDHLLRQIAAASICGLGGGRFPTATKLAGPAATEPLLINAMQSEPDNDSDLWLLAQDPAGVADGIMATALACNAQRIICALPELTGCERVNTGPLSEALEQAQAQLGWRGEWHIKQLPVDPASGAESLLAQRAAGLSVPLDQPLHRSGALSVNLATTYAIARAVFTAEPLLRRVVTVDEKPRWVWLGTPVAELLAGPVMLNGGVGGDLAQPHASINAGHFCVSPADLAPSYPCINCGQCAPVCPANLQPDQLHKTLRDGVQAPGVIDQLQTLAIDRCIECGLCNTVCPSNISLAQQFRQARQVCTADQAAAVAAEQAKTRVDARNARLAHIDAERDAARQAREQREW